MNDKPGRRRLRPDWLTHQQAEDAGYAARQYGRDGEAWLMFDDCEECGADAGQACTEKRGQQEIVTYPHVSRRRISITWATPRAAQDELPDPDIGAGMNGNNPGHSPILPRRKGRAGWYQRPRG